MARITSRVLKKGQTSFTVEIRLKGFPSISKTFRSKKDAFNWASLTEGKMLSGRDNFGPLGMKKTLSDAILRFRENPSTKNSWLSQKRNEPILKYWDVELGHFRLIDLKASIIVEKRDQLLMEETYRKTLRTNATSNRYLSGLSLILRCCVEDWGWLEKNPARSIRRLPEKNASTRFLSSNEKERLYQHCIKNKDLHDIVLLALNTGARRNELQELKWKEVDLNEKLITFKFTKNGEDRTIPISNEASMMLERRFIERNNVNGEWVFPAKRKDGPMDFYKPFLKAIKEAEIKHFRFHDLRHTAGSYLASAGVTERFIAEILGHKTLEMVKRYTHLKPEHLRDAIEVLGKKI